MQPARTTPDEANGAIAHHLPAELLVLAVVAGAAGAFAASVRLETAPLAR